MALCRGTSERAINQVGRDELRAEVGLEISLRRCRSSDNGFASGFVSRAPLWLRRASFIVRCYMVVPRRMPLAGKISSTRAQARREVGRRVICRDSRVIGCRT